MPSPEFASAFLTLAGKKPFPWQERLYTDYFAKGETPNSCSLPTGLGKTSVIAVWLIALANGCAVPRRLVYIVNRRTVVDQTTNEVNRYRELLENGSDDPVLNQLLADLRKLSSDPISIPLAVSTLRGQFADNREWSSDPSRPAVICGTVDMIGSRLLFSGYGCGFKTRPLQAGFLGQDTLIIHDEAHLEPAFQNLLLAIESEQRKKRRDGEVAQDYRPIRVMELTATSRTGDSEPFQLSSADLDNSIVKERYYAKKALHLHENKDPKKLAEEIAALAKKFEGTGRAVLIYVRRVQDVKKIVKALQAYRPCQLTGTMRGRERDALPWNPVFARFLQESDRPKDVKVREGTVYLVCTSAGEVGINASGDHLVCDLSTYECMGQRNGRVNRFGMRDDSEIHVIYPKEFDKEIDGEQLLLTLGLLELLGGDASPSALSDLRDRAIREGTNPEPPTTDHIKALRKYVIENPGCDPRSAAFAPPPIQLSVSEILLDALALTNIRELPDRPPVDAYLHGLEDDSDLETYVAWRQEVKLFEDSGVTEDQIAELLDLFPLKPHELLWDRTYRVQEELERIANRHENEPVWVIDPDDTVHVLSLGDLAVAAEKNFVGSDIKSLVGRTVILPPVVGGLLGTTGTLEGGEVFDSDIEYDVAGLQPPSSGVPLVRLTVLLGEDGELAYRLLAPIAFLDTKFSFTLDGKDELTRLREVFVEENRDHFRPMRVAFRLDLQTGEDDAQGAIAYLVLKPERPLARNNPAEWPSLEKHLTGVEKHAKAICSSLGLPSGISRAVCLAAKWHDLGKYRKVWQNGAGNLVDGQAAVAKTLHGRAPENLNGFRHELASMVDVCFDPEFIAEFRQLSYQEQDLLLHLIATHHGRGRPHFNERESIDPERPIAASKSIANETPRRYARLQRQHGRWGLAFLESLLRAADALDSKHIEDTPIGDPEPGQLRGMPQGVAWAVTHSMPTPSISLNVEPTNPGQFLACCGVLELADRLWPGAEGWFSSGKFHVACSGGLDKLLNRLVAAKCESAVVDTTADVRRLENGVVVKDLLAPLRLIIDGISSPLLLDSWMTLRIERGEAVVAANPPWNFWSGQQTPMRIWPPLCAALRDILNRLEPEKLPALFEQRQFLSGRFGFDPGPAWNALDVGFSPNEQGIKVESSPAVELLAAIGLQRFRPMMQGRDSFDYATWGVPLSPEVARAAAAGSIHCPPSVRYRGRAISRGQYGALAYSTILSGDSDE